MLSQPSGGQCGFPPSSYRELTHSQFDEIPIAVPFARACNGNISGTYTHGIQLAVAPNINMYEKKKVTLADAVLCCNPLEYCGCWKLSRTAMSIMEIAKPREPHIMGFRRPSRSRKKVGTKDPTKNMHSTAPPTSRERLRLRPTFS